METINSRIFSIIDNSEYLSDTNMAKYLGCSKSTVSRWRREGITPHSKYTGAIAEYLGVSVIYLLKGERDVDNEIDACVELLHRDKRYRVLLDSSSKLDGEALEQLIAFINKINSK